MAAVRTADSKQQWEIIKKNFCIDGDFSRSNDNGEDLELVVRLVQQLGAGQLVLDLALDAIWLALRQSIVPKFWQHFVTFEAQKNGKEDDAGEGSVEVMSRVATAVSELYDSAVSFLPQIHRCEMLCEQSGAKFEDCIPGGLMEHFKLHLRATLHSQMPSSFTHLLHKFYSAAFKVFYQAEVGTQVEESEEVTDEPVPCGGCGGATDACHCQAITNTFCQVNKQLLELDLLERLAGDIISSLLLAVITDHVSTTCRDSYDQSCINQLEKWVENVVVGWLELVYCGGRGQRSSADTAIQTMVSNNLNQTYMTALYHTYTTTRIDQLFNIVIEYPESQPALEDIRECLDRTHLRDRLVESLRSAIQTRLLHPGVNTTDVLHAYISAIKALRVLDPKGVLLELVSEPVRQYLRGREDTVRYIVTSLTDESCSELSEELLVAAPLVLDDSHSDDDNMDNWETWTPDPVHAHNLKSKSQRTADIISMLVNIYGSKDVFITEYRTILADRILSQFSYDTEREIRYLEHLKVRFGETLALLHKCEVMVKDVADSKRINTSINSDENPHREKQKFPVSAMILSTQFWPSFKEERLQVPDEVTKELENYTEAFQDLKGNRTLNWKPHLGQVQLEIELKNRTLNLTVTPTQATIIYHFQERNRWSIDDLSTMTQVPKTVLRRKITYWQTQGVLQEVESDVFVLVEGEDTGEQGQTVATGLPLTEIAPPAIEEDEAESVMASAQDQREEELQVFWSYIVGMLTNLDCLPLERIHAMLKMFVQGSVECSPQELRAFLDRKVRQHQLLLTNGLYKLPKN
ncbi:anaphase-promoting complex subunit 2-like [Penaeus japonicus]|uniref:anaphase-promoting complex subunit 2-like n=1 Tax=Penaeus japonicus TaxID=27405 RepID=UPI001C711FE5|nr:anaphase-promoting complex subunit 2-like [Penaeus japonicus]